MTQEDVVRMAREAGVFEVSYPHPAGNMVEVERFAALVAAAEREACARMFDGEVWSYDYREIAAKIRERGQE